MARLRISSGLILFTYAFFHFINIGLGLFSADLMDRFQTGRQFISRNLLGTVLLHGSLLVHAGLALWSLATRRTLRMPLGEALQYLFGLAIPLLLIEHLVHTRLAHEVFDVNDRMSYITMLIWGSADGWWQSLLLLLVWIHGCIGLQRWLRSERWWRGASHWMAGLSVLIPTFALAGFMVEGRRMRTEIQDEALRAAYFEYFNFPDRDVFDALIESAWQGFWIFVAILALAILTYLARRAVARRKSVRIQYVDGPEVSAPKGLTLLEMSRVAGVPHTALCGGHGRCTTCRVVIEHGSELLEPPSEAEKRSLQAVNASPGTRLACQIRPKDPMTVFRVFLPDGKRGRAHASQGRERRLAILFVDMRGFTSRTTGQLPYDVVFLLNRFFDAIVPPIINAGGDVDKYLGDGLLAVFELGSEEASARAALEAAAGISAALIAFNQALEAEQSAPVTIGMGLHLGELVLGEIGAANNAPRTIIGDTVNATSRMEAQTKELGVEALVSADLLVAAGQDISHLSLVTLELRGVAHPIDVLAAPKAVELPTLLAESR